jgi:carbon monoxide dehydrogenase subunit G
MEMTGEQIIPAAQADVWRGLNDPEILKACISGCESIEKLSGTEYAIVTTAAIGPVKARFKGKLSLADLDPPNSYSLSFDGQGGAAGFAKGSAKVSLAAEDSGTRLSYTVKAQIGGKLAQIGSRLIDGVAKKLADDFFTAFNQNIGGPTRAAAAAAETAPSAETAPGAAPLWWVVATIAAMFLLAYFT